MLHIAAQDGIPEMIEFLLKQGANVNALDEDGSTAAKWAANNGHIDAIKIMFEYGLDLSFEHGQTMAASLRHGNVAIVQLLLDKGVSLDFFDNLSDAWNSENGNNMPLLRLFCASANIECIAAKITDAGAKSSSEHGDHSLADQRTPVASSLDPEFKDSNTKHTKSKLESFGEGGQPISEEGFSQSSPRLATTLNKLISCRQYETLTMAVEYGLSISSLTNEELGLLCICSTEHNLTTSLRALVAAKASPKIKALRWGWTALHVAASKGHVEIIKLLRAGGWDIRAVDDCGRSALHIACINGQLEVVTELLGEIDAKHGDADGNTPLHFAARQGNPRIVSLLIESGAILEKPDVGGVTPMHLACQHDRLEAAKKLIKGGSSPMKEDGAGDSALHYSARFGATTVLNHLLTFSDLDLNTHAGDGSTPLHHAAQHGSVPEIKLLLNAGADFDMLDNHGRSPIEVAMSCGKLAAVKALIRVCNVRWHGHRSSNILFRAFQSKNRRIAAFVISTMISEIGEKKSNGIVRSMCPELLAELLTSPESSVSVCALLVPYLPKDQDVRYQLAYHILMSCIKHSDNVELAESLLKIETVMARQVTLSSWTPLHSACKHGRRDMVKLLLRYGARVDAKALESGVTPLELARKYAPDSGIAQMITRCKDVEAAVERYPQARLAWVRLKEMQYEKTEKGSAGFIIHNMPWRQRPSRLT